MDENERTICGCAALPPSVERFHAVCRALSQGIGTLCLTDDVRRLPSKSWFSEGLILLAEDPLSNPANDWKTTLTIADGQILSNATLEFLQSLVEWTRCVPKANSLCSAVKTAVLRFEANGVKQVSAEGNLKLDNSIFILLLQATKHPSGSGAVRKRARWSHKANFKFDHAWICRERIVHLRDAFSFLAKRFQLFCRASDDVTRRVAFTISADDDLWFNYYIREFCVPTPPHLQLSGMDERQIKQIERALLVIDAIGDEIILSLSRAATDSSAVKAMSDAWSEVLARFSLRCDSGMMPTYAAQISFAQFFAKFKDAFSRCVESIGRPALMTTAVVVQTDEEEDIPLPDENLPKSAFLDAAKMFCETVVKTLIKSKKVKEVHSVPTAIDYILTCKRGQPYSTKCKAIVRYMDTYGWQNSSLATFCYGHGRSKPKPNKKHRDLITRNKRKRQKDWDGVGLDEPDTLS